MTDGRRERDGRWGFGDVERRWAVAGDDAPALASTVVRYDDRSDRVTVYPGDVPDDERTTTWMSVNSDIVVGLEDVR